MMTMKVFLLDPILGSVSEIVRGEMSEAVRTRASEGCPAGGQYVRKRKLWKAQTILVTMSRDRLPT